MLTIATMRAHRLRALLATLLSVPLAAQRVADHEFRPLLDHDGRTNLSELYGQPVVIAGFEQHLVTGVHAAWVASHLLQLHAEDGLIVILEDQRPWTDFYRAKVQAFWTRIYGTPAWLSSNLGTAEDRDLPIERKKSERGNNFLVLIGVDGNLVMEGQAENAETERKRTDFRVAFERAVAEEIKRRKRGWGDDPIARKARAAAFGKSDLAAAWKVLAAAEDSEAVQELGEELDRSFAARKKTVRFYIDQGRFVDANRTLSTLRKSARGLARYAQELRALEEELGSDQGKAFAKLDRTLMKILEPLADREFRKFGPDEILAVRRFAEENAENPVGARAAGLDTVLVHIVAATKGIGVEKLEELLEQRRG